MNLKDVSVTKYSSTNIKTNKILKLLKLINFLNYIINLSQSSFWHWKRSLIFIINFKLIISTTNTKTTENSKSYNRNFQQKLIDDDIYFNKYEYFNDQVSFESNNLKEINSRLVQSQLSLSPSQFFKEKFKEFKRVNVYVSKENKTIKPVISIIKDKIKDDKYVKEDILFTNLTSLTNNTFITAKSDLYYNVRPK